MAQATTALDPRARLAIKKHSRLASNSKVLDPMTPEERKALSREHSIERRPVNSVKGFPEVEFKNNG